MDFAASALLVKLLIDARTGSVMFKAFNKMLFDEIREFNTVLRPASLVTVLGTAPRSVTETIDALVKVLYDLLGNVARKLAIRSLPLKIRHEGLVTFLTNRAGVRTVAKDDLLGGIPRRLMLLAEDKESGVAGLNTTQNLTVACRYILSKVAVGQVIQFCSVMFEIRSKDK